MAAKLVANDFQDPFTLRITLVQDGVDVNLQVNGQVVAFVDGDDGKLKLIPVPADQVKAMPGLQFTAGRRLVIE
jgi:hypothetical protein